MSFSPFMVGVVGLASEKLDAAVWRGDLDPDLHHRRPRNRRQLSIYLQLLEITERAKPVIYK
jgi:hypothetical protein